MVALSSRRSRLGIPARNTPPARIFMGDVGSAFLGVTLAFLTVIGGLADARLPFVGVLVLWPFVFDTTFTILRRGENIFAAHRSHLYQRLVIAGYSHSAVTLLYIGLATVGAILALLWTLDVAASGLAIVLSTPLLCWGLWACVVRNERRRLFDIRGG